MTHDGCEWRQDGDGEVWAEGAVFALVRIAIEEKHHRQKEEDCDDETDTCNPYRLSKRALH